MEIGNLLFVGRETFVDGECPLRIAAVNGVLCSKKHCSPRGDNSVLRTCDISAVILRQQRIEIGVIPIYASLELVFFPPLESRITLTGRLQMFEVGTSEQSFTIPRLVDADISALR